MCCETTFCYLVHALCTNLYLHPFLFRSQYRYVQTLVSVAFWYREPVAQTFRVRLIHIGYYRVCLPAESVLRTVIVVLFGLYNYSYSEQVVNTFEATLLFLHLLPDAVNTLCPSLHVEVQSCLFQSLFYRLYELLDILVTTLLSLVEFTTYHVVCVVLQVLQRQVFQFTLQFIKTKLVSQWSIEVACLLANPLLCLLIQGVSYLSHQVHTVGNHDKNNPHVFGKRQQQISEVLAFYDGVLFVELLYSMKSVDNPLNVVVDMCMTIHTVKYYSQYSVTSHSLFLYCKDSGLQSH